MLTWRKFVSWWYDMTVGELIDALSEYGRDKPVTYWCACPDQPEGEPQPNKEITLVGLTTLTRAAIRGSSVYEAHRDQFYAVVLR